MALFGIGTFPQINAITESLNNSFSIPIIVSSIVITILVILVTLGGIKSISKVSEMIVPFMAIFYVVGCLIILGSNISVLPESIMLVIKQAFTPTAAIGGFAGATVRMAIQNGVARGVFSNESGLGSAPIAAAAAKTKSCVRQGLVSMTGTFFDTIVICTMTGLVLITTGAWKSDYQGAALTSYAFSQGLPVEAIGIFIVTIGLLFFAFTTIIGWNYYGERCTEYLFGVKGVKVYRYIFIVIVAFGATLKLNLIWTVADIVNALMAFPNLIGLIGLSGVVYKETKLFFESKKKTSKEA